VKNTIKNILSVLLVVVFCISTGLLVRQKLQERKALDAYERAAKLAVSSDEEVAEKNSKEQIVPETEAPGEIVWVPQMVTDETVIDLQQINLAALREENPDVIGWIYIPDTKINYPVMQGEDNEYYLNHAWDGKKNASGSIFMETNNDPNATDFNTIIYGHKMNSGVMFAALHEFEEKEFWEEHPYVYLVTDAGIFRYEIFSTYNADVDSSAYGLSYRQNQTRINFLIEAKRNSLIDTGIEPETTDRILTLSTCTGRGYSARRVVHARLKMLQAIR